jgi:hypothetical protein
MCLVISCLREAEVDWECVFSFVEGLEWPSVGFLENVQLHSGY